MQLLRKVFFSLASVLVISLVGCSGGVQHPDPGKPNSIEYCGKADPTEQNCSACASKPGCGWCDAPVGSAAHCQPGTSETSPASCSGGWRQNTEMCEPPPPPL